MSRPQHPSARVDEQADPQAWIEVLDRLRADPLYARYKGRVVELLDPAPGRRHLEIGTGTGADAIELARRYGVEVVGLDSSVAMVEEARRRGLANASREMRIRCPSPPKCSTARGRTRPSSTSRTPGRRWARWRGSSGRAACSSSRIPITAPES